MNKLEEKRAIECIRKLHEQMKLNIDVIQDALKIIGMSIDLLSPTTENEFRRSKA